MVNGLLSTWSLVTSGRSQESTVVFINDLEETSVCTFIKSVDDTKLWRTNPDAQVQEHSPRDLDRLEKWTNRKLMKFIEDTYKVLHLGRKRIQAKYNELGAALWKGNLGSAGQQGEHGPVVPWHNSLSDCINGLKNST